MLKTKCKNCIFQNDIYKCIIDKETFIFKDDKQYTEGFCRHKRDLKWMGDHALDMGQLLNKVFNEELGITAIIIHNNKTLDDIKKTLETLFYLITNIKEVLIVSYNLDKNEIKEIAVELSSHQYDWQIENILGDTIPSNLEAVDYICGLVKNNWFMVMESGETISEEAATIIKNKFYNSKDNFLCFYSNSQDKSKILTSKFAFMELKGNSSLPWIEKAMMFNNWEKVCHQIN